MQTNFWRLFVRKYEPLCRYRRNGVLQNLPRNVAKYSTDVTPQRTVDIERFGKVFVIGINRPEKRNCIDPATGQQLIAAFNQFNEDPDSSVAVLYGKGGVFSAGLDLSYVASGAYNDLMKEFSHGIMHPQLLCPKNRKAPGTEYPPPTNGTRHHEPITLVCIATRTTRLFVQEKYLHSISNNKCSLSGGTFCAGADLSFLASRAFHETNTNALEYGDGYLGPTRMVFNKPVIAAVSGYAVAGGLELALMCDLRVVEETAIMGVFNRRFDVPLIDGGTIRLPHLIGLSRALDMILTGRQVTGKEALDMGLANRVVSIGTALGQAMQLASNIAKFPQASLLADRKCAYDNTYGSTSFEDALRREYEMSLPIITDEVVKGAQNFVDGQGRHGSFSQWKGNLDDSDKK